MEKFIALSVTLALFIAGCDSTPSNQVDQSQRSNSRITASSGAEENTLVATADSAGMSYQQNQYQQNQMGGLTANGDIYPTHPDLSSVTNKPLPRITTIGSLVGTYANIVNDEGLEASSNTGSFVYGPLDPHFDEVNLYYHIDRFRHNFIRPLDNRVDGLPLSFTQITARAHSEHPASGEDIGASYYSGELYFGDASSHPYIKNTAKEDKVIYHEYSHAVMSDIHHEFDVDNEDEEAAIYEGIPDYFAGSFTGRPVIGEYVFGDPNVPNEFSGGNRDMADPEIGSYNEYLNYEEEDGIYIGGEFFSSILWDLRESSGIDSTDADFLVYDALYRLGAEPTFLEFRDAMIAADSAEFVGQYSDLIQNTFAAKGIGDPAPPLGVTIYGSYALNSDELGTWSAAVSNSNGPVTYTWYRQTVSMCSSCWFNAHVNDDHYSTSFHNSADHDQDAAVKVVVSRAGETAVAIKQISINGCDTDDPPILPKSGDVSINKEAPPPCPSDPPNE